MIDMQISSLLEGYKNGTRGVREVIREAMAVMDNVPGAVWIERLDLERLEPYLKYVEAATPAELPLYGIPFVIKDNIDLAGVPTTAGCPDFTYIPGESAFVVQRLLEAGAIPLAKTNLDQFATGLVGTRSPYGACPNSFDPEYVSGGSSSGSAYAVASGCCSFSLGTDTAGSGRVPACFNNLVGLKPSRGLISCRGVVPACRSLDCVSIFAQNSYDAGRVLNVAGVYDEGDAYSRSLPLPAGSSGGWKFGVPKSEQLKFFGNAEYEKEFYRSITLLEECGGEKVVIDFQPFIEAANLLYSGPWVNERYAAVGEFIENNPGSVLETTRKIVLSGLAITAPEVFGAMYKLQEYKQRTDMIIDGVDFLLTPTAGTCYRIGEVQAKPIELNTNLGFYTNYMNLLDYAAVAVPTGMTSTVPFGVTLVAPAGHDRKLLAVAAELQQASGLTAGRGGYPVLYEALSEVVSESFELAVCGAHLKGFPLHRQLVELGAEFAREVRSAPEYRMYALSGGGILKPGLIHDSEAGAAVYMEIYRFTAAAFGKFVGMIPAPLGIGKVKLEDGSVVSGFIAEAEITGYGTDITAFADWRRYTEYLQGKKAE